jgi:hypothetical protein
MTTKRTRKAAEQNSDWLFEKKERRRVTTFLHVTRVDNSCFTSE